LIEHDLAAGALPENRYCVRCGTETDGLVHVETQFGMSSQQGTSRHSLVERIILAFLGFIALPTRRKGFVEYDKEYSLPVRLCLDCQMLVHDRKTVVWCMKRVPAYGKLLEKYPDARLTLVRAPT
jgi:hypothetical protein